MNEHKEPIPSMIYNASIGGHVTNSQQIIDENENKEQSQINAEVKQNLGQGGSVDTRINQAKSDIIGDASSNGNTLKKLEDRVSPIESAVGTGGNIDTRIEAAVNIEKTRAEEKESTLNDKINIEKNRAEESEENLNREIYTLKTIVGTESSVNSRISDAVAKETTRAQNAESTLQTNIDTETTRAQTAEEQLRILYNNLQQSQPIPVTELPDRGEEGKIYRLAGTTNYSDYMWNGTQFVKMATYNNAIDNEPIIESKNLVKSGGVFTAIADETTRAKAAEEANTQEIAKRGIYDVSANNNGAVFESLSALLNNANLSTLIPASVRYGGMSIRFIQGSAPDSDNKYMQYRLMSTTWSTTVTDWQGVDYEPTVGSNNLVKSGGVMKEFGVLYKGTSNTPVSTSTILFTSDEVSVGDKCYINAKNLTGGEVGVGLFDSNDTRLSIAIRSISTEDINGSFIIPENFSYAKVIWNSTALAIEYIGFSAFNENIFYKVVNKEIKGVKDEIEDKTVLIGSTKKTFDKYTVNLFSINKAGEYSLFIKSTNPLVKHISLYLIKGTDASQASNRLATLYGSFGNDNFNKYFVITPEQIALGNGSPLYISLFARVKEDTFTGIEVEASLYKNIGNITRLSLNQNDTKRLSAELKNTTSLANFTWSTIDQTINNFYPNTTSEGFSMENVQKTSYFKSIKLTPDAIANKICFEVILWDNQGGVLRKYRRTELTFTDADRSYPYFVCTFYKYYNSDFHRFTIDEVMGKYYIEWMEESIIGHSQIIPINKSGYDVEIFNIAQVSEGNLIKIRFSTGGTGAVGLFDSNGTKLSVFGADNGLPGAIEFISKIPTGFSYAKSVWGSITVLEIENLSKEVGIAKKLHNIDSYLTINDVHIKDYFVDEMEATIHSIEQKVDAPCLVFNIITDSHLIPSSDMIYSPAYETISNVRHLNSKVYVDGVIHLGDVVSLSMGSSYTDDEIYAEISKYINTLALANRNFFPLNGNHDGEAANSFKSPRWYGDALRGVSEYAKQDGINAYYYKDYKKINARCIFLSWPDSVGNTTYWTITDTQLQWLINTVLNVANDTHVIIFCHGMPLDTGRQVDIEGILNAFSAHSTYSNGTISCDFSQQSGTKLVAWINGHHHRDHVAESGWQFTTSEGTTLTNNLVCPVINIGSALKLDETVEWGDTPARNATQYIQDLWDTMIYRPDLNKIYMVRFGAGEDREISV